MAYRESSTVERAGLTAAVEQAADAIIVTDACGTIQYVNSAFGALTGYGCEEAVGRNPRILKSGQQPPSAYQDLWNTIRSGGVWQGELINRRRDGTVYHAEMRVAPVRGPNGEVASYIAVMRDVTGRQAADDAQRFLAAIAGSSADAVVTYTPAGIIRTWNRGAEAIFGYAAGEVTGTHVSGLAAPEQRPRLERFTGQVLEGIRSAREGLCLRKDGARIHVSITACPIRNSQGNISAVCVILRDISRRKRTVKKFHEHENLFRVMADGCPALMWVTNAAGRVEFINRAYGEFFGTPPKKWKDSTGDPCFTRTMLRHTWRHAPVRCATMLPSGAKPVSEAPTASGGGWRRMRSRAFRPTESSWDMSGFARTSPSANRRNRPCAAARKSSASSPRTFVKCFGSCRRRKTKSPMSAPLLSRFGAGPAIALPESVLLGGVDPSRRP